MVSWWQIVIDFFNPLISGGSFIGLKRRKAHIKCVNNDSNAPDIDLEVISFALENFRGDVVGSPTNRAFKFPLEFELGCESEITNLDIEVLIDEDVSEFQISVDDVLGVQELDPLD